MRVEKGSYSNRGGVVSAFGLMISAGFLVVLLATGTISYRAGVNAGQYDAAHDSWNNGYQTAADDCMRLLKQQGDVCPPGGCK